MKQKRKYKILITNHSLQEFRGSETYCLTLSKELAKDNEVFVYTPKQGKVSKLISKFATIIDNPDGEYDMVLYNHNNTISDKVQSQCKIYTSHGIFHKLEKPIKNIDRYVAVSDEVAQFYSEFNPSIIRNGIDLNKFKPNVKNEKKLNVLYSSSSKSNLSFLLRLATFSLALKYKRIGRKKSKFDDVSQMLEWSDIVIGLGRTAIEGLAYNKKVIVADKRPYTNFGMDGLLTENNVMISQKNNYSGRAFKKTINFFSLRQELKKAKNDKSKWERNWIINNHNIESVAEMYINLAEELLDER